MRILFEALFYVVFILLLLSFLGGCFRDIEVSSERHGDYLWKCGTSICNVYEKTPEGWVMCQKNAPVELEGRRWIAWG